MSVRLIVDSTADLTPESAAQMTIVPLSVHFGSQTYLDGVDITRREFYEKLIEKDTVPTTSQATPQAFLNVFDSLAEGEEAVVLTISSRLSGTYQSACIAAADYPGRVFVVDSLNVAMGSAILAEYALRLAKEGRRAWEIAAELEKKRHDVRLIALLDTLEYLKRGGRISKTVAIAGAMLSIKPVLAVEEGDLHVLGKARGSRQGNNLLVTEIGKAGGVDFSMPVLLGYTGIEDTMLQKYVQDSAALWKDYTDSLRSVCVGSVVGTHAGPGAVAVAFFRNTD